MNVAGGKRRRGRTHRYPVSKLRALEGRMIAYQLRGVHAALPGREKCVLALNRWVRPGRASHRLHSCGPPGREGRISFLF